MAAELSLLPTTPPTRVKRAADFLATEVLSRLIAEEPGLPSAAFIRGLERAGMLEPVIVVARNGTPLRVLDGVRRIRAAEALGWIRVPVALFEEATFASAADRELRGGKRTGARAAELVATLAANYHRSHNAAMELRALERLRDVASLKQIRDETGIPIAKLQRRLRLLKLRPTLRTEWETGGLTTTLAESIAKLSKAEQKTLDGILTTAGRLTAADVRAVRTVRATAALASLPPALFELPPARLPADGLGTDGAGWPAIAPVLIRLVEDVDPAGRTTDYRLVSAAEILDPARSRILRELDAHTLLRNVGALVARAATLGER